MCGHGYMLGPGLGEVISRMIIDKNTDRDKIILENFSLYRKAGGEEKLK
jgi:sarcosine oxidase subunit beta